MGKIGFTREIVHFDASKALEHIIWNELKYDSDFISSYEQRNNAEELRLGKMVHFCEGKANITKENVKKYSSMLSPDTEKVDYVVLGTKGYFVLTSKINSNGKRGSNYYVGIKDRSPLNDPKKVSQTFTTRKAAELFAKEYALRNLDKKIVIVNDKEEIVAGVVIISKYYDTKPRITESSTKKLVNGYYYLMEGLHYVG